MTNEIDRITEIAKANSSNIFTDEEGNVIYNFETEELLAFEQAILAKRDESYLALQEEVDALNGALILSANKVKKLEAETGVRKFCEVQAVQLSKAHREEIDHLKAQLARQAKVMNAAANNIGELCLCVSSQHTARSLSNEVDRLLLAINATAEDVAKYKAEIEKSVLEEAAKSINEIDDGEQPAYRHCQEHLYEMANKRGGVR